MPSRFRRSRRSVLWVACGASLAVCGCAHRMIHAASPAIAPAPAEAQRPMSVAPDTNATPPVESIATPPAVSTGSPSPPPAMASSKPVPPRRPAEESAAELGSEQPARAPAPQIAPQLSPSDQASYQRKTNDDVSTAEKNLQQANGKQLNAPQRDLVEKIRSFLAQSRDASRNGDWTRAQNLAQKARLLSVELVNSF